MRGPCLAGLLVICSLPAQEDPVPGPTKLREVQFDDFGAMPLHLTYEIKEELPKHIVRGDYVVARERRSLRIDTDGDGEVDAKIGERKAKVVEVGTDRKKPWLVWHHADRWWMGPGRAWQARLDGAHVTVLDGNLDGEPGGDEDWIRFEDGAFFRHHVLRLVPWGEVMAYYRFEERDGFRWIRLRKDARTPGATDAQWQALLAFNRLRMRSGLAPTRIEPSRGREMQSLAMQLAASGYAFDRPFRPFEQRVGDILKRPALRPVADPAKAASELERTMVSRLYWLGTASRGFGYGNATKDGTQLSVFLLGGADVRRFEDILVYPAPGQEGVPRSAVPEQPFVETDPKFWKKERGIPILLQFGEVNLRNVEFVVWRERRSKKPVKGTTFGPEAPANSQLPENLQAAFFVPDEPLDRHKRYWVECKFRLDYQPGSFLWSFVTQ